MLRRTATTPFGEPTMLTNTEIIKYEEHAETLQSAENALVEALYAYNSTMNDAQATLEEELKWYNAAVTNARKFVEAINDKYPDLDWTDIDLDDHEIHFPRELSTDAPDHARDFAELELPETEEV
jgi:hypothetical protein